MCSEEVLESDVIVGRDGLSMLEHQRAELVGAEQCGEANHNQDDILFLHFSLFKIMAGRKNKSLKMSIPEQVDYILDVGAHQNTGNSLFFKLKGG